ncbi:MAG: hypothetical protein OEZ30_07135 [Candidatus Aminicenantes bacterium]|nr:hypothetical protein [Candidatus Aminicenantes bacterium]
MKVFGEKGAALRAGGMARKGGHNYTPITQRKSCCYMIMTVIALVVAPA